MVTKSGSNHPLRKQRMVAIFEQPNVAFWEECLVSRLMSLMLTGDTTPERLRLLSDRHLDHLAAHGPTPQLRADVAEIAVLARAAADRSDADPDGWGRPSRETALARLQAEVLYAILGAEEAWRVGVFDGKGPDGPGVQGRQRQIRGHLERIRAAMNA